jgi:hypothetical protein
MASETGFGVGKLMRWLQKVTYDLKAAATRLRVGTSQAANRVLEETELLKLRLEARKLDRRINDLCRDIGERAVELHEQGHTPAQVLIDREIIVAADQVIRLKAEREKLTAEMDDAMTGT